MGSPMLYHSLSVVTCRHPFVGTILRFTGWMGTRGRLAGQSSEVFAGAVTGLCGVKEDCANAATPTADARRIIMKRISCIFLWVIARNQGLKTRLVKNGPLMNH